LRARFKGKPEYVMRFMRFIARELREIMAQMGLRTLDEMVGRTDLLVRRPSDGCWKRDSVDLSALLDQPEGEMQPCRHDQGVVRQLQPTLDESMLCVLARPALEGGHPVTAALAIHNTDRATGT